jgi:hypothetical protein
MIARSETILAAGGDIQRHDRGARREECGKQEGSSRGRRRPAPPYRYLSALRFCNCREEET